MLSNPVVISIVVLLALSLLHVNVVIALVISALTAGLCGDLGLSKTIEAFTGGLGGGAEVAMNYAMLGAFAIAISKSGITDLLAYKIITRMNKTPTGKNLAWFKYMLLGILLLFAISSQNLLPVHIAFIPIVVPPLLSIFNRLKIDRRAVACIITFGLTATYMILPVGFGKIFIESVLVKNINLAGAPLGLQTSVGEVSFAMLIPVIGMMILSGLAVNMLLGSAIALLLSNAESPWALAELYRWLQGSLMWAKLDTLLISLPIVLAGIFCLYHSRRYLDLLTFGEETASTMGVDPKRSFFISTFGVALLVGATIPQTGTIGFIGLIAPHFARILLKARPSQLYLTSALIGALLLLLADLAILYIPLFSHIYIGTLTALIGAPCLIWMLLTQQRKIYD